MHPVNPIRIAAAALCAVALAAGTAFAQQPLRIGAINPYSGPLALYGDEVARGYQLAVDEKNAKGGALGRKVELVRGDAGNPQQGIAAVDQLVTRDKVDLFIGLGHQRCRRRPHGAQAPQFHSFGSQRADLRRHERAGDRRDDRAGAR